MYAVYTVGHSIYAYVVDGAVAPELAVAIAPRALLRSDLTADPDALSML